MNLAARRWTDWLVMRGTPREDAITAVQGLLDDTITVKPRRASPRVPDAVMAQVKPITQQYQQLYRGRYGENPEIQEQERINIVKLLRAHGPQVVSSRLNAFFEWDDAWVEKTGRTLGIFYKQWNALTAWVTSRSRAKKSTINCHHEPPCRDDAEHTKRFLDEQRSSSETTSSPRTISNWKPPR